MAKNTQNKVNYNSYCYGVARQDGVKPYVGYAMAWTSKSKDPILHPEKDGKKEWVESTLNLNEPAAGCFARAEGKFDQNATYDESPFVSCAAFNAVGKKLSELAHSTRIAVAGVMTHSTYKSRQSGKDVDSYRLLADAVQVMGEGATLNRFCTFTSRVYEKNGQQRTIPMVNLLMCKVTNVGQLGSDKNGRSYLFVQCDIAMDQKEILDRSEGKFDQKKQYYKSGRVTLVFTGKAAEARVDASKKSCLQVGQLLCVTGAIEKNEYNGNTYCRIRVDRCAIASNGDADGANNTQAPAKAAPKKTNTAAPAEDNAPPVDDYGFDEDDANSAGDNDGLYDDDDDGELPF